MNALLLPCVFFRALVIGAAGWVLGIPTLTKREVFPSMLLLRVYSQLRHRVVRASQWEGLVGADCDSCRSACRFAWR